VDELLRKSLYRICHTGQNFGPSDDTLLIHEGSLGGRLIHERAKNAGRLWTLTIDRENCIVAHFKNSEIAGENALVSDRTTFVREILIFYLGSHNSEPNSRRFGTIQNIIGREKDNSLKNYINP